MNREQLRVRDGQTVRVTAEVVRYGSAERGNYRFESHGEITYLLSDICDAATGEQLADHLWMPVGKWADGCRPGDTIAFTATVEPYEKRHPYDRDDLPHLARSVVDWTLVDPSNLEFVIFGPERRMLADGSVRGGER